MGGPVLWRQRIVVRCVVLAVLLLCRSSLAIAQPPPRPEGWVVIPVDEYRALRLKAFPPDRPADPPPLDAALTRVDYELRAEGDSAVGEARLIVDILKDGWVRVDVPAGLLVRAARIDGRTIPIIEAPSSHVLLSKPGRVTVSLDIVVPLKTAAGTEALALPASRGAVSRLSLVVPRAGIDVTVSGGVLAERAQTTDGRWIAFGRAGQPLTMTWKRRTEERAAQPLRWRGTVVEHVGLGEDASQLSATVNVEVSHGVASAVDVAVPDGAVVNQVSGPLVADWDFRGGVLKVNFLEPVSGQTTFSIAGEARVPRDGAISVPLIRLPAAEREAGGIAVEVLGAGEIGERQPRGLEPADPSELGGPVAGRDSPSMLAFTFRPQPGTAPRSLAVNVARYTPQAVLIANVDEARYDALVEEEGKMLVRARYAVRNNQRAFLGVTLPQGATLWGAAVANRPLRPGLSGGGALLLPLEKGRAGEETPAFVVELTYVQRAGPWSERGRVTLTLPAVDLPIARTGVVVHHSPRYRITPEPGTFRARTDTGPFTAVLRGEAIDTLTGRGQGTGMGGGAGTGAGVGLIIGVADELVAQYRKDVGRTIAGPLPVRIPFPAFGPEIFLLAELTPELQSPSIEISYKRESRW